MVSSQGQAQLDLLPPDMVDLGDDETMEVMSGQSSGTNGTRGNKSASGRQLGKVVGIKKNKVTKVPPSASNTTNEAGSSSQQSTSGLSGSTPGSQTSLFHDSQGI